MLTIAQKADLRKVVLEFLCLRFPNSYSSDAIARMLNRRGDLDYQAQSADIVEAASFLKGEEFVISEFSDPQLDVTPGWSATSKGLAHWQRQRIADDPQEARL